MGINFSPFEIGRRALRASQLGLTVSGQNIANVNTPGYTRRALQVSPSPPNGSNLGLVGNGVSIDGVRQLRDQFIESRLRTETAIAGRLTAQRDALSPVDAAFNESDGNGISAAMSKFFSSFGALEANPVSTTLRNDVIAKTGLLSASFAATRSRLVSIQSDADSELRASVSKLNTLSQQIAELNVSIANAEHSGGTASELRDQRDQLVQDAAQLSGVRAVEDQDGMVSLTLGDGQALVSGAQVTNLQVQDIPPSGLVQITLNGQPAVIFDGRLRGLLNAADNIEEQITSLDDLAASIASRVNALHSSGTDLNSNPGINFFQVPTNGPLTAANLTISAAIKANPSLIVASPLAPPATSATVAGAIAALLSDPSSQAGTRTGSFSSIYASIVSEAGKGVRSAEDALVTQQAILNQTLAQRDAISGVSLDEEAINLLQYQKSYEAAARFLKIADELTQTILSLGQ